MNEFEENASDQIAASAGCTACSALITPTDIYVANAGDSRAVIGKKVGDKYISQDMSEDHKPELKSEKDRIENAGGFVEDNRVKGVLALSRAIGDLQYKGDANFELKDQMLVAIPEIRIQKLSSSIDFLIIACDGIWDCLTSEDCVTKVGELLQIKSKPSQVVEEIFDKIIASDVHSAQGIGCDNMTCIVVQFKH